MKRSLSRVAIVGLGYVGLPLASLFLKGGWEVFGVDIDQEKIDCLKKHKTYLSDFSDTDISELFINGSFFPSSSFDVISKVDVIILCIPTPLTMEYQPELKFLKNALEHCKTHLKSGQILVLESSTYPGTTEEELCPIVESLGFTVGKDFYVAYSPERIDPGNHLFPLNEIPKLVGGVTLECTKKASSVYETIFNHVVCVTSPKVAEMSKLVENSQRLINISFMNELLLFCEKINIDLWEVIEAASTKPFGFTPYYPGPGIGGHCIPVDPMYLLWRANKYNLDLNLISQAHQINEKMPNYVVEKIEKNINNVNGLKGRKILIIGVAYKRDVNDLRESSALKIIELLLEKGAIVEYFDPYIPQVNLKDRTISSINLTPKTIAQVDCTLILTDHSNINYELIVSSSNLVIDTRNVTKEFKATGNIINL